MRLFTFGVWMMIVGVMFELTGHEVRQERQNRALIAAVAQGNAAKVVSLLDQGADANARELPARSPSLWQWMLARGHRDAGRRTLRGTAPARTALLVAVEGPYYPTFPVSMTTDNPELVAALLRAGADVNARDESGSPALLYAARNEDRTVVALLLSYDADVNMRPADGSTLLMTLIGCGVTDRQILGEIASRSDLNARDHTGRTALMIAVLSGNVEGVRLLLSRRADADLITRKGESSLSLAYSAYRDEPAPSRLQIIRLLKGTQRHGKKNGPRSGLTPATHLRPAAISGT